jgi:dCMP deaminase
MSLTNVDVMTLEEAYKLYKAAQRQEKWDRRYLEMAKLVSTWSKDPSTQVGAVLVNYALRKEFVGYNGFPAGVPDEPELYADREQKYPRVVHAEVNAILKAGDFARGATLYVYPSFTLPPVCAPCAGVVIQAGVQEIVGYSPDLTDPRVQRWVNSIKIAEDMCRKAGITWRELKEC